MNTKSTDKAVEDKNKSMCYVKIPDELHEINKKNLFELNKKLERVASRFKKMNFGVINKECIDGVIKKMPNALLEKFEKIVVDVQNDVEKMHSIGKKPSEKNSKSNKIYEDSKIRRHLIR